MKFDDEFDRFWQRFDQLWRIAFRSSVPWFAFNIAIHVAVFVFLTWVAELRPYAHFVAPLMCLFAIYGLYKTFVLLLFLHSWNWVEGDSSGLGETPRSFKVMWYTGLVSLPCTLIFVVVWGYTALI